MSLDRHVGNPLGSRTPERKRKRRIYERILSPTSSPDAEPEGQAADCTVSFAIDVMQQLGEREIGAEMESGPASSTSSSGTTMGPSSSTQPSSTSSQHDSTKPSSTSSSSRDNSVVERVAIVGGERVTVVMPREFSPPQLVTGDVLLDLIEEGPDPDSTLHMNAMDHHLLFEQMNNNKSRMADAAKAREEAEERDWLAAIAEEEVARRERLKEDIEALVAREIPFCREDNCNVEFNIPNIDSHVAPDHVDDALVETAFLYFCERASSVLHRRDLAP